MIPALFFTQLQAALRDDPPEWQGVIDVRAAGAWYYVATTNNIGPAVCHAGQWPGGADITIEVNEPAWSGSVTAPATLPVLYAAGQVTIADSVEPSFALTLWGIYLQKRIDYVVAHPL